MSILGWHPSERQLSLYAGEDLSFLGQWLIGWHVRRCPASEAKVAAYVRARTELLAQPPVPEPDFAALGHRIRVEAAQNAGPQTRRRGWRLAAAGAGAAAVAVAIALILPVGSREPPVPRRSAAEGVLPPAKVTLLYEGVEAQLTAEGTLSVRSFHPGSGVLTVTDYYAP